MSRRNRPHLPGGVFHLTSRTSGKEHWFSESIRDQIVRSISRALHKTDALLLAYVVMSNHFHLVVRQGAAPLGRLMHAICRETALAVQREQGRGGTILDRPYRDWPCESPEHLRNAIVYTHLNPVAAGLVSDASLYSWSSHLDYCGSGRRDPSRRYSIPNLTPCLEVFASTSSREPSHLYDDYKRVFDWRHACRMLPENGIRPPEPPMLHGDAYWYGAHGDPDAKLDGRAFIRKQDLRDLVLSTIREFDPQLDLQTLRIRKYGWEAARLRRFIITRALTAGFAGVKIARFLQISETTVSKVATSTIGRVASCPAQE